MKRALRLAIAAAILLVLVQQLGTRPFLQAFDHVSAGALFAAILIVLATTVCSAWRWSWIAQRQGLELPLREAVPAYYRSQLLNQVLPGGVLGDVHRAVRHGSEQEAAAPAARAVIWERVVGQVGLAGLTLVAVLLLPSALPSPAAWLVVASIVVAAGFFLAAGRPWLPLLLSVLAASGHLLVLLLALRATGVDVPTPTAVPLLLVVLVASSIPTNLAGWGPREGAAAWVFGAAGVGAAEGVTVTTVYAILSLVASLPGVLVLLTEALPRRMEVAAR